MIADFQTNLVCVSYLLRRRYPDLVLGLESILREHDVPLVEIPGTRDVWCRDYLPVQIDVGRFVQFRYAPDYLSGRYQRLRADGEIGPTLPQVGRCERSKIVLDGGNVVGWTNRAIVCEKVFAENPGWKPSELIRRLERLLEVERVIVIPTEPGDVVGHSDGVVRFVDGGKVLRNNYRGIDRSFGQRLQRVLEAAGMETLKVPYRPAEEFRRAIPSAFGNYVNFLRVGLLIVMPVFGISEDVEARDLLIRAFPTCRVETLAVGRLAEAGGLLNCCTWTIRKVAYEQSREPA